MSDFEKISPDELQRLTKDKSAGSSSAIWEKLGGQQLGADTSMGTAVTKSAGRGLWDIITSGASTGAKMMAAGPEEGAGYFDNPADRQARATAVEPAINKMEEQYQNEPAVQAHPLASNLARIGGNIAGSAPLMAVPGMGAAGGGMGIGARSLLGAGQGAMAGAATGGAPGAIGGGLAGGALGAAGGMIGPMLDPALQKVANDYPSLAFMALRSGKVANPGLEFQRSVANETLKDIGEKLTPNMDAGSELIAHVHGKVDAQYDKLLPKVTFKMSEPDPYTGGPSFKDSILPAISQDIPESKIGDWNKLMDKLFIKKQDANGNLTGRQWKDTDSEIGEKIRSYQGDHKPGDDQEYAKVLRNLRSDMRANLATHNPAQADAIRNADKSWHKLVLLEQAAGRRANQGGEFTPADLLQAARSDVGNRRYARGQGVFTAYGKAGLDMMASKPPNFRQYLSDMVGAGIGAGIGGAVGATVGGPIGGGVGASAGAAAGGGAGALMRNTVGRGRATPIARKLGETIGKIAPVAGSGIGGETDRLKRRLDAARKIGEIQGQRHSANSRGDFQEMERLGKKLAEAHRDYRDLGGTA